MHLVRLAVFLSIAVRMTQAACADPDPPKLPGTAAPFAGVPWGSTADTIKATLAQHGFTFTQTDADGDLVFSGDSGGVAINVFEVLDSTHKLVKTVLQVQPGADDLIATYDTLSSAVITKYGKPSEKLEQFEGSYRGATSDADKREAIAAGSGALGTFFLYSDGSSIYVIIDKNLTIEAAYEGPHFSAEAKRRNSASAAAASAAAASAASATTAQRAAATAKADGSGATVAFVGPPGWTFTKGSATTAGTWTRPGDSGYSENIVVLIKENVGTLDVLLDAEMSYARGLPYIAATDAPVDATVCGSHPAKYITYTYEGSDGTPLTTEDILAVFGTTAYSVRYTKSITQYADTAAERAMTTLCGRAK